MFYVVGLGTGAFDLLGPGLTALSAGATVALALSLAEAAAGVTAGVLAAVVVTLLPAFIPLHRASVHGPPLLVLTVFTLAAMVHAPRFSFAYGGAAAIVALFVSPSGIGVPVAAAVWAFVQARRRGKRRMRRVALAIAPLVVGLVVMYYTGSDAWNSPVTIAWRGGLDAGLSAAGRVFGDQLAPGLSQGALRWIIIADSALVAIALVAVAWRRVAGRLPSDALLRRFFEASGVLAVAYAVGLALRTMLIAGAPDPDLAAVLPIVVIGTVVVVVSIVSLWPRWSRAGKLVAVMLGAGWMGASILLR